MTLRIKIIIISLLASISICFSQQVSAVYKIADLLRRIDNTSDTIYIINFWATWCVPCVNELPEFDMFALKHKNEKIKVLLVSLDFKEDLKQRVNPFLKKHHYGMECVLLDEVNGNDFINQIEKKWTGAIPATFATQTKRKFTYFAEKKLNKEELESIIEHH